MSLPKRLGKYSVEEVLGQGAMGTVYKAFDPHIRRTVALKVIRKELVDDHRAATLIARFKNEAQAAGRLNHPGIVSIYEYGEDEAAAFIAMEYVQGTGLGEYFNRGTRFGLSDVVSIMTQLLDALAYAHEAGVVHRDIKPANLIIVNNGKLKVADFGIAHLDSSNLTQIGAIMGTPGYMAPEQYNGMIVDQRADLFSSGVVFYELLTGVRPFAGNTEAVAYKICYEGHLDPSTIVPELKSTRLDGLVGKALAKKADDRYRSAQEFCAAILAAYPEPVRPTISEEVIIYEGSPVPLVRDTVRPVRSSTDSGPVGASAPRTGWDDALLKQIEQQLTRYVGPVAKVIVKRGAKSTKELDTLYALLAESLSSAADKQAFLAGKERLVGVPPPSDIATRTWPGDGGGPEPLTSQETDQAAPRLAAYLGPIAKIIVKKAAAEAKGRKQFYLLLAEHLASEADRERFLRDVGVQR